MRLVLSAGRPRRSPSPRRFSCPASDLSWAGSTRFSDPPPLFFCSSRSMRCTLLNLHSHPLHAFGDAAWRKGRGHHDGQESARAARRDLQGPQSSYAPVLPLQEDASGKERRRGVSRARRGQRRPAAGDAPDHVDDGRVVKRDVLEREQLDGLLGDDAAEEGGRRREVRLAGADAAGGEREGSGRRARSGREEVEPRGTGSGRASLRGRRARSLAASSSTRRRPSGCLRQAPSPGQRATLPRCSRARRRRPHSRPRARARRRRAGRRPGTGRASRGRRRPPGTRCTGRSAAGRRARSSRGPGGSSLRGGRGGRARRGQPSRRWLWPGGGGVALRTDGLLVGLGLLALLAQAPA